MGGNRYLNTIYKSKQRSLDRKASDIKMQDINIMDNVVYHIKLALDENK